MPKHLNFGHLISSFNGQSTFKSLVPDREKDLLDQEMDPTLRPEERAAIRRYLKYADTLLNASEETAESDGEGRVSQDKKAA